MVGVGPFQIGLSELLGALLGVFLGQVLTIWWDRRKRRRDRQERRRETERSIASELGDILEDIERLDDDPETEPNLPYPTAAYRSSVESGRFSLVPEGEQLDIAQAYERISQVQDVQEQLQRLRLRRDEDDQAYRRRLRVRFNDNVDALQEQLPDLIDGLDEGSGDGGAFSSVGRRIRGWLDGLR